MSAIASQLIVTEAAALLRNATVSINQHTQQIEYLGIFDGVHEQANTLFFDGILSPPMCSLWQNKQYQVPDGCIYIDLINNPCPVLSAAGNYVFDIHTTDAQVLNAYLRANWTLFNELSSIQLIAGFCSNPTLLSPVAPLRERLWWQNTDLVQKKITHTTKVSVITLS